MLKFEPTLRHRGEHVPRRKPWDPPQAEDDKSGNVDDAQDGCEGFSYGHHPNG
jgi:hypothetical protein